jgi:hypothetical protein
MSKAFLEINLAPVTFSAKSQPQTKIFSKIVSTLKINKLYFTINNHSLINNLLHISFVSQCLHASGIINIVKPNIPDTIANIKQKSLHGRYFKELEQPEVNIQASHAWLKKSNIHPETEGFIFAIQDRVIKYKKL